MCEEHEKIFFVQWKKWLDYLFLTLLYCHTTTFKCDRRKLATLSILHIYQDSNYIYA